jgi:DNA replication and repair protein RecF
VFFLFIESLILKNYRNYKELDLSFNNYINIFIGDNAQGKTNVVESLYFLSFLKSHRFSRDKDLILFDRDYASIQVKTKKEKRPLNIRLVITDKGKKITVNQIEQKRLSEFIGLINTVMFSPEDLELIKGNPSNRRRFLDMEIGQINHQYLVQLNKYNKLLKQRNEYLKSLMIKEATDITYLKVLTGELIKSSSYIYEQRFLFTKNLLSLTKPIHKTISNHQDDLNIKYSSGVVLEDPNFKNVHRFLEKKFEEIKKREIRQGQTLFGPHKDDLEFFINDRNVRIYCSQGQQRSVILSLKLAEIDLIKEKTRDYPILILDDVLSELDDFRKNHLLNYISNKVQTFVTTTSIDGLSHDIIENADKFLVEDGIVISNNGVRV